MKIKKGDKWNTVFKTWYGYFKYQVMPFGISNIPASFTNYINKILAKKHNVFIIVYLDDILIYTKDIGQIHVNAVRWVLNKLKKYGFFANLKKCCFYKDEVQYLSYIVSAQRVKIEDEQIKVVKNWPEPKSMKNIQVFLGFANFYQRFIQTFAKITGSLTLMLQTSSITRLSKNLLLSMDVAKSDKVSGVVGVDYEDGTVKRSPRSKNSNRTTGYLTSDARQVFI